MNERLRLALTRTGMSASGLAEAVEVDPKTVHRWLGGRTPHPRHRHQVARLLNLDRSYLWPEATSAVEVKHPSQQELVTLYPHRSAVPTDLWLELIAGATASIDVLAYAALFLPELDPRLVATLQAKADRGVAVRLALGDPSCPGVRLRGEEERIGSGMAARVSLTLAHLDELVGHPGIEFHQHGTTLYNSIFRFDDEILVNSHLYGAKAYENPVLHLRRTGAGTLFDAYLSSFECVWAASVPYAA